MPCPTYPEIGWRCRPARDRARISPKAARRHPYRHRGTDRAAWRRRYCRKTRWPFTTSYHTRFPEYVAARLPIPEAWCYALQRRFHNGGAGTFVATQSVVDELAARGFERLMPLVARRRHRAVPAAQGAPVRRAPVFLYVGRIAVEKNIKAFLDLDLPGRKVVVGGGPQARELRGSTPM